MIVIILIIKRNFFSRFNRRDIRKDFHVGLIAKFILLAIGCLHIDPKNAGGILVYSLFIIGLTLSSSKPIKISIGRRAPRCVIIYFRESCLLVVYSNE